MTLTQAILDAIKLNATCAVFGYGVRGKRSRNIVEIVRVANMGAAIKRYDVFQGAAQ